MAGWSRSPVPWWRLRCVAAARAARGDVLVVAAAYALPLEAVLAARTYYLRHAAAFDARLRAERGAGPETHRAA